MSNVFSPSGMSTKYIMKQRLKYGRSDTYNFRPRSNWYPMGWKLNHRIIAKQFSNLHLLACHSPEKVQSKWRQAYNVFMNKHFGNSGRGTMRYLNKYSCHSWL